ncbi:MAG: alanine--tRNA ligase [Clostridia bacterium]|nr:alanine--tRNA ligase [Clostridia bacterium]
MKYTGLNELREKYLSFFETKGHLRLPSFSLVPQGDKSLLLINSGMAPMKKYFTGEVEPPRKRVCTCQKCIRTPDLERVGKTARHGTYFEMLGNFSFGDYFKREAIHFAWEFLTVTLEIPKELLWPSIYEKDEEAFHIWKDEIGVEENHIVRLGKADNFWEHGSGPCGPCSEIYFDRGEKYGCGSPDCKPGCECDRYMEIWNNVFTQFNNDGNGNYTELTQKNIDTGMGLERLACVMQGVDNMFEVDTVRRILDAVCAIAKKEYGKGGDTDVSIRIITDHIRSSSFMICDGVIPSNEGRGYVLRRILRRAARHGRLLGIKGPFLADLCTVVVEENEAGYPEMREKEEYIKTILSLEEEKFNATCDAGLAILSDWMEKANDRGEKKLEGEAVFKLYDTYGFPIDLTREIAEEKGFSIDEEGFTALMQEQKERARAARANISGWSGAEQTEISSLPKTRFCGYEKTTENATVLAIFTEEGKADTLTEGEATVILDTTPFYGESGGQVGDTGIITAEKASLCVMDTKKSEGIFLHTVRLENGTLSVGDKVLCVVDAYRRDAIRRNHSSVHLLQAALREVLGDHVEQAGSFVDEARARFDFKHFRAMSEEELSRVEALVNEKILQAMEITTLVTDADKAKEMGAMALFDEKYGDEVRMVSMGEFSRELCGGTHMDNTARIGLFRILSEQGVAAGIRRIEAVTGKNVLGLLYEKEAQLREAAETLKTTVPLVPEKVRAQKNELKLARDTIDALSEKLARAGLTSLIAEGKEKNGLKLIFAKIDEGTDGRKLGDLIRDKEENAVAVLYQLKGEKILFFAVCGKGAVAKGAHAGNVLKTISPIVGGGGGGRPDSAQSGGKDATKLPEAEKAFYELF